MAAWDIPHAPGCRWHVTDGEELRDPDSGPRCEHDEAQRLEEEESARRQELRDAYECMEDADKERREDQGRAA